VHSAVTSTNTRNESECSVTLTALVELMKKTSETDLDEERVNPFGERLLLHSILLVCNKHTTTVSR